MRDEALAALLDRTAVAIEAGPADRLPEVIRRGTRRRAARFAAIVGSVAVFAGAVAWVGLSLPSDDATIPADVGDWRAFASLEENGWTIQVPPPWRVQELPACANAPERIGVIVTNVDFEFRNPRNESPQCEDRFVLAGFPKDGVALALMPTGVRTGGFFYPPYTTLPLTPDQLIRTGGIRGGPAASFQGIYRRHDLLAIVRRWVGPEAPPTAIVAMDKMLASLRVRGIPRWIEDSARSLGEVRIAFVRPEPWTAAAYPHAIVIDAPTPILRLRSDGVTAEGCRLPGYPWIEVGDLDEFGAEIVVADATDSFAQPNLPARTRPLRFSDASDERTVSCGGDRFRLLTFGFREAGRSIFVHLAAAETIVREQSEMLRYILNSIEIQRA